MKTIINDHKLERGQIIPIVVVALITLIAMAALILDGGALMSNRRASQNAADAAALAGARVLCRQYNATDDDIEAAINQYIEANHATLIEWKRTDENVGVIEGLFKGEVVVTAEVEHGSFFAKIFGEDMLTATATAGAGCFPYGPSVVLPIAFPCYHPSEDLNEVPGEIVVSEDCDYAALDWEYFASIATGCGMGNNPLIGNVDPTEEQAQCIRDYLYDYNKELIYVIVNEEKYCATDPENADPNTEVICELIATLEGHYQLSTSARGWLNLGGNPSVADMTDWIKGIDNPSVRVHSWLSFIPGVSAEPVFGALEERLFDIVWIPVFNEACDHEPVPNDDCYDRAHAEFPYPDDECPVNSDLPGQDFAHVVAFAPFFTSCVRNKSNDLKDYLKDYGYDSDEVFISECPGFGMAVNANDKANMEALADTNYSFEGYFIDPWYLENPEDLGIIGADLGIYTVSLTR